MNIQDIVGKTVTRIEKGEYELEIWFDDGSYLSVVMTSYEDWSEFEVEYTPEEPTQ